MSENGKKKLIYGLIGFGCGIALSGIMMVVVVLNTNEYQQGLINYISSSDVQANSDVQASSDMQEDIGQMNAAQPSSIEEDPVNSDLTIQEGILEETLSDQYVIEENIVSEDNQEESGTVIVYIPPNSTAVKICKILQERGVILDAADFGDYIKANNKTKKLRSGNLMLPSKVSYEELLKHLEIK